MPKQPIAVELEAINRDSETQVVPDRAGLQRLSAGDGSKRAGPSYLDS